MSAEERLLEWPRLLHELTPLAEMGELVALTSRGMEGTLFDPLVGEGAALQLVTELLGFAGFAGFRMDEEIVAGAPLLGEASATATATAAATEAAGELLAPVDGEAANELSRAVKSPDAR